MIIDLRCKSPNNCINADRFYTPRRFTLLCVKPSGYAERYAKKMEENKKRGRRD
jgi:hypothetical protein